MVIFLAQANPFSIHEKETEEPFSFTSRIVSQYNAHHSIGLSCQIAVIEWYITYPTGRFKNSYFVPLFAYHYYSEPEYLKTIETYTFL